MRGFVALLLLLALLAGFLLNLAELLDVYCDGDADCKAPTVCRLVCRRNCKSVCVLVVDEKDGGGIKDFQPNTSAWWTKKPEDIGVLKQEAPALKQRRKLHRRPTAKSDESAPFDTEANPFAAAALPFRSPLGGPLPPPEKKPKEAASSSITPLTISEAELEAELRQMTGSPDSGGPDDFVTAPGSSGEMEKTTSDPFEPKGNSRELFATAPPRMRGSGRTHTTLGNMAKQQLTLSTSMELVGGEELFRHRTAFTTVSPPSFSPQPPGFMPQQTSPSRIITTSTKSTTTTTTTTPRPTTSTTTPTTTTTSRSYRSSTTIGVVGRHPPTERSKENNYSGEEFEQHRKGGKPIFYKSAERPIPWFPKAPLVRPISTTISPLLAAMRRTTQRVPIHRPPFGNWLRTTTVAVPTTQRTTLKKCDAPPVCGRNCGVVIDTEGCQSCQCLWTSKSCFSDVDCRPMEGQVCDLGRCECGPGYEHHSSQSGVCQVSQQPARQRGVTLSQSSPIPASSLPPALGAVSPSPLLISGRSHHQVPAHRQFSYRSMYWHHQRRLRRAAAGEKPHREERLQWPGPCDSDDQCPPQLYCVEGDCWTLEPERAQHRRKDAAVVSSLQPPQHSHAGALVNGVSFPHQKSQKAAVQQRRLLPLVGPSIPQKGGTNSALVSARIEEPKVAIPRPSLPVELKEESQPVTQSSTTLKPPPSTPPIASAPNSLPNEPKIEEEMPIFGGDSMANKEEERDYTTDEPLGEHQERHEGEVRLKQQNSSSNARTTPLLPTTTSPEPPVLSSSSIPTVLEMSESPTEVELPQATIPLSAERPAVQQQKQKTEPNPPSVRPPADFFLSSSKAGPPSPTPPSPHPRPEFVERRLSPLADSNGGNKRAQQQSSRPIVPLRPQPLSQARFEAPSRGRHKGLEQIRASEEEEVTTTTSGDGANTLAAAAPIEVEMPSGERRIFYDYSRQNRIRRPVRVQMTNSKEFMKDECRESRECGRRFVCCLKRWCDLGGECGTARFCLPSCELTKLAHLSELAPEGIPRLDLVYD